MDQTLLDKFFHKNLKMLAINCKDWIMHDICIEDHQD
jgi:hypothetical protein